MNSSWQNFHNSKQIQTYIEVLNSRKQTNELQLMAYRWKNFSLLNSTSITQQRKLILEELTSVNKSSENFWKIESEFSG